MVERKVQNWKSVCEDIYKSIHEFVNDPSQVGLAQPHPRTFHSLTLAPTQLTYNVLAGGCREAGKEGLGQGGGG